MCGIGGSLKNSGRQVGDPVGGGLQNVCLLDLDSSSLSTENFKMGAINAPTSARR